MRAPLTLFLGLSLLIQSLPLVAGAQEAPPEPPEVVEEPLVPAEPEPVVETPTPIAPVIEEPALEAEAPTEEPLAEQALTSEAAAPETPTYLTIEAAIALPNGCTMTDASGTTHVFPTATTTPFLAACALAEALQAELLSEVTVQNADFGLYVSSINGVAAGENEYWSIWINDGYAECGISCQALAAGDEIAFVRTAYDPATYAETPMDRVELSITSLEEPYINVFVPKGCSVADTAGTVHAFTGEDLLGVCALQAAAGAGLLSYALTNASFGLYVSSVGDIPLAENEYWALWHNGAYAECGVACLPVRVGDTLSLVRTTFDNEEGTRYDLRVIGSVGVSEEEEEETPGDTGGAGGEEESFDTAAAFAYLASLQEEDGSIENDLVTDWAAVAFSASGAPTSAKSLLKQYLKSEEVDLDTPSDYIRHAMALLALGINPYTGGPEDYLTPIVESFDGTQLGETAYINDDIFALFPLTHAGYSKDDELIQDLVSFIVSEQAANGSWEGIDMTAAAVQALAPLSSLPGVPAALEKAEAYLRASQEADGGFGDVFATTWAIQAIGALGDNPASWEASGGSPRTYLASIQEEDGSVRTSSGTLMDAAWATAYAIPAAKGLTWHDLMDEVRRQEPASKEDTDEEEEPGAGEVLGASDEIAPEPLTPAFTFEAASVEAPVQKGATYAAPKAAAVQELPLEAPARKEPTQTAAAANAPAGSWLMNALAFLWEGLAHFLKNLFS